VGKILNRLNLRHPARAFKVFLQELYTKFAWGFLGSNSQHGEDFILHFLLNFKKQGFYVDIGANDPDHISNSKYFYDRGWNGINVELARF